MELIIYYANRPNDFQANAVATSSAIHSGRRRVLTACVGASTTHRDNLSSKTTGFKMLALLVSTMQPFMNISSTMKWAFSRLNMMSNSHCVTQTRARNVDETARLMRRQKKQASTYHTLVISVQSFDQAMNCLKQSELVLVIIDSDANDKVQRSVSAVDDLRNHQRTLTPLRNNSMSRRG